MSVTSAEMVKCYGHGLECKKQCRWKEPCMNRSREEKDDIHYTEHEFMLVGKMEFDENDNLDDEENFQPPELSIPEPVDESCLKEEPQSIELYGITVTEQNKDDIITVLQQVSMFYFDKPKTFHALMCKVMKDMNQSDIARQEGVTRACVNKRLRHELGIDQKNNDIQQRRDRELAAAKQRYEDEIEAVRSKDEFLRSLSARDWQIYKLVFVDGCSYQSAAKQSRCTLKTVYRVSKLLRSKMNENVQIKRGRKKKN